MALNKGQKGGPDARARELAATLILSQKGGANPYAEIIQAYRNQYAAATTDEARRAANAGANQARAGFIKAGGNPLDLAQNLWGADPSAGFQTGEQIFAPAFARNAAQRLYIAGRTGIDPATGQKTWLKVANNFAADLEKSIGSTYNQGAYGGMMGFLKSGAEKYPDASDNYAGVMAAVKANYDEGGWEQVHRYLDMLSPELKASLIQAADQGGVAAVNEGWRAFERQAIDSGLSDSDLSSLKQKYRVQEPGAADSKKQSFSIDQIMQAVPGYYVPDLSDPIPVDNDAEIMKPHAGVVERTRNQAKKELPPDWNAPDAIPVDNDAEIMKPHAGVVERTRNQERQKRAAWLEKLNKEVAKYDVPKLSGLEDNNAAIIKQYAGMAMRELQRRAAWMEKIDEEAAKYDVPDLSEPIPVDNDAEIMKPHAGVVERTRNQERQKRAAGVEKINKEAAKYDVPDLSEPIPVDNDAEIMKQYADVVKKTSPAVASWEYLKGEGKESIGYGLDYLGANGIGQSLIESGQRQIAESYARPDKEWEGMQSLSDPEYLSTTAIKELLPTLAGPAAKAALARLGPPGLVLLGAAGTFEAAMEAGRVRHEAIKRGMSEEEADQMADETFRDNLLLKVSLNIAGQGLSKAPKINELEKELTKGGRAGRAAVRGAKLTGNTVAEGIEELGQKEISAGMLDDELTQEQKQEALARGLWQGALVNKLKGKR